MEGVRVSRSKTVLFSVLAGCVLMAAFVTAWVFGSASRSAVAAKKDQPPVYARAEFTPLVMGKSEDEVLQAVGKPDLTSADSEVRYWHYRRRTRDPRSGDMDTDVQLVFRGGKVTAVNY